jgi:predicted NBD/HSP70 family sugar kinase
MTSIAAQSDAYPDSPATLVSGDVRRHNLSVIANYLVAHGPNSRTQIADGTGLTRGAVTALVSVLLGAGILSEAETVAATGRGRPQTRLELTATNVAIVAAQLDADRASAVVVSLAGDILFRVSEQHGRPMGQPDAILDVLARVVDQALDAAAALDRRILDFSIVVFAPVGGDPEVVLGDTDLDWGPVDVIGGLRARTPRLPDARLTPDSSAAALAELSLLPGVTDLLYLKSNSGIGGALIVDGQLVTGGHGVAGALGHLPIDHDGAPCGCGQRGCLVTVAGPDVVLEAAGLGELLQSAGLTAALEELTRRVAAGDQTATVAWEQAAIWVGRALQILTLTLDPQAIVLGGYWAELSDSIRRRFVSNHPVTEATQLWSNPRVLAGQLGEDAALLGAVWSARDRLLLDPLRISN